MEYLGGEQRALERTALRLGRRPHEPTTLSPSCSLRLEKTLVNW